MEILKKRILCLDAGGVLNFFSGLPLKKFIVRGCGKYFSRFVKQLNAGLSLEDFFLNLKREGVLKQNTYWDEFLHAYYGCFLGQNEQMLTTLTKLKKSGKASLVMITDGERFAHYICVLKYPAIYKLFRKNSELQVIRSDLCKSIKANLMPFIKASQIFGFTAQEACFVDDRTENLTAAQKCGFEKNACFLYKASELGNHERFEKFLDFHFP